MTIHTADSQVEEMRQYMLVHRYETDTWEEVFNYSHRSKLRTKLWELRNGKQGRRISKKEREKFLPKES